MTTILTNAEHIPFIIYKGDTLPTIRDTFYSDKDNAVRLDLTNVTSAFFKVYSFGKNFDSLAVDASGKGTIIGPATTGVVDYTFTAAQTTHLADMESGGTGKRDISCWQFFYNNGDVVHFMRANVFYFMRRE